MTRGNKRVDDFFVLRDTLLCYSSTDLAPLYFRKGAREGKRYTVDEDYYSYANGKCHVRMHRQRHDGTHHWKNAAYEDCVFDMIHIFLRAQRFDPAISKKVYVVTETIKADNGLKYRCLRLAYMELEDGKYKRIVDFYVTDDENHVPVRLDMFLKFGSAKAFLVGMKGTRNPITSIVK